ncbi:MAG: dockerin type I repeat-containing protein [Oscillospiraceae bacterium]|nr:dockerin type I repeat-containing protein [Oscillospiraceae bacterium]
MLRRRIFSGAMASVMALSSVAVVASAEETQVVAKADLEKLVNETYGDAFRTDKLSEYGTVSAENVLDALEAADAILADDEADAEDYTVAYKMVEATVARLVIYSAEDLQGLIDDCKSIYESNNIYNEELQDLIYTVDTYDALVTAYDNANVFVTSTSSSDITEAYEQLAKAKKDLKKLTVVSKSMFRSVMKQYESIIDDEFKYETWRRGSFGGWAELNSGNYWILTSSTSQATFGQVWSGLMSLQDDINSAYQSIDAIKTLSKTSDTDIVNGYQMAQDAVAVYNGWTVDSSSRATKSGVNALLKEYHSRLVYDFAYTSAANLYALIDAANGVNDKGEPNMKQTTFDITTGQMADYGKTNTEIYGKDGWRTLPRMVSAAWNVKSTVNVYVPVDGDGYWTGDDLKVGSRPDEALLPTGAKKWQLISAKTNFDITKLIRVTADDVNAAKWGVEHELGFKVGDNNSGHGFDVSAGTNGVMDQGSEWMLGWGTVVQGEAEGYLPAGKSGDGYLLDENGQFMKKNDKGELEGTTHSRIMLDLTGYTASSEHNGWAWEPTLDDYNTTIAFSDAYALAMDYLDGDKKYDKMTDAIDTTGVVADNVADGTSKEWAIVYRYLKYALEDRYTGSVSDEKYTRADVKKLIEDCYDLAELTGDAAIFEVTHNKMVDARQDAKDWVTAANSDKLYKEYTGGTDADGDAYMSSTQQYKTLKGAYDALLNEYNAMKYSFGEIYDKIAEVSEMIDDGELEATTALTTALEDTAYALSVVDDLINDTYDENPAFDADRVFQAHNRVITNTGDAVTIATINQGVTTKDGANPTHAALATAYDALLAEITAQTAPQVLLGDVDGNGVVNALDAGALLKAIVDEKALDLAVADFDKSGAVNALDAGAILKSLV